jgi:hypothetical protein
MKHAPWLLLLWPLLSSPVVCSQERSTGLPQPPAESLSRFHRTVLYMREASPEQQADFATNALSELAEVYMAEADLAQMEAGQTAGAARAKLLGWSFAVNQYASQLILVIEDIEQGFPVVLAAAREGVVSVTVAGRAVILGHPRPDQQTAFEQRVLSEFCGRNDCKSMTALEPEREPIPVSAARFKPAWTFTDSGPVCSHDGIELRFGNVRSLGALRSTCEELLQEATMLATEIAWQRRHGVVVDWNLVLISATPQRPEHLVRLNAAGDSILVTLPLLYGSPGLLDDLKSWLRYRTTGADPVNVQLNAAKYGWVPATN